MERRIELIIKNKKLLSLLQTSYLAYKNGIEIHFVKEYYKAGNEKVKSFKEFVDIFNFKIIKSLTKLIEKENFYRSEIIYDFYYPQDNSSLSNNSKYFVTNKKILISDFSNDFSGVYALIDIKKIKLVELSKWTGKLDIVLTDDHILSFRRNFYWSAPSKYIIDHIIHISDSITKQIEDLITNDQEENFWLCLSCLEKNSNENDTCSTCGAQIQELEPTIDETSMKGNLLNGFTTALGFLGTAIALLGAIGLLTKSVPKISLILLIGCIAIVIGFLKGFLKSFFQ